MVEKIDEAISVQPSPIEIPYRQYQATRYGKIMAYTVDSQFSQAIEKFRALLESIEPIVVGDVATRREVGEHVLREVFQTHPMPTDVSIEDFLVKLPDESSILLRWYCKQNSTPGSAVLYLHGGGLIFNDVGIYDRLVANYVSKSGVPFLSVDYRKAPEYPYPTPIEDCYSALCWLHKNAKLLQVDPNRLAVMGDSAGGGLSAALTILSRDRNGPSLAKQILIYPMLDDRNTVEDPKLAPYVLWTNDDNLTAWQAYLGETMGTSKVTAVAAPAHLKNAKGLPSAYIEIGELDIFRNENIEYARLLANDEVSTEFHLRPGVNHAWEVFTPTIPISIRAMDDRIRVIQSV
ncbi:alpha/beta hydrolase fold domain-containing protein [Microbulbifer sp. JMSA002]|uniref:alpha/beta hydrolase fold domain-containing protein n=1 Tax=Microbulbifer sp. JMSA002 TaxID=3243368 RepID=UPI00403940D1